MKRLFVLHTLIYFIAIQLLAEADYMVFPVSVPHIGKHYSASDAVYSLSEDVFLTATYTNNFFLPQVGLSKLELVYPSLKINTSASLSYFGYKDYWVLNSNIGFSKFFKPYISIGVSAFFSTYRFSITSKTLFTGGADISICIFPVKNFCIGLYAENITFSPIVSNGNIYRLPVSLRLGFSYYVKNNVSISIEGAKELKEPFSICVGVEYLPVKQFLLRISTSYQKTASFLFGVGLRLNGFLIDFDAYYNLGNGLGCKASIGFYKHRK